MDNICTLCNNIFILSESGKRYRKLNNIDMNLCQKCINSITSKRVKSNMSDDKKRDINSKISESHKNRSDEDKKKTSDLLKSIISNRSNKERIEINNKRIITNLNKSSEELSMKGKRISDSWNSKSQSEKELTNLRKSIANLEFYKNESAEDRANRIMRMSMDQLNRSDEDKAISLIKFKNTISKRSIYDDQLWRKHISDYYKNESLVDFETRSYNSAAAKVASVKNLSKTELTIMKILQNNMIHAEHGYASQLVHNEFYKLFPINPITGQRVFPHHAWDFKVNNILIDIDGSEHTIQPKEFITKDGIDVGGLIQFNDSQRPYQTDGLDAYIVMVYNDRVSDAMSVFNIQTGVYVTFKMFIEILKK